MAVRHYWLWQRPFLSSILANYTAKPQLIWRYVNNNYYNGNISNNRTDDQRVDRQGADNSHQQILTLKWSLLINNFDGLTKITQEDDKLLHWYSLLLERPFRIQYQYVETVNIDIKSLEDSWWTLAEYYCFDHYDCQIGNSLIPYTKYRVREFHIIIIMIINYFISIISSYSFVMS